MVIRMIVLSRKINNKISNFGARVTVSRCWGLWPHFSPSFQTINQASAAATSHLLHLQSLCDGNCTRSLEFASSLSLSIDIPSSSLICGGLLLFLRCFYFPPPQRVLMPFFLALCQHLMVASQEMGGLLCK